MDPKELRGLYEAYNEVYAPQENIEEASYSAKAARAGKDIGKPGKQFAKIAKEAGKRYGSEERGKKVAGAVLAKLRAEDVEIGEAVKGESSERRKDLAAERREGHRPLSKKEGEGYASYKLSQMSYAKRKRMGEEVEEVGEEMKPLPKNKMFRKAGNLGRDIVSPATGDEDRQKKYGRQKKIIRQLNKANEEVEIFDVVLEFLQVEGYAETLEEAEWMMANIIDEEAIDIILGEEQLDEISKELSGRVVNARIARTGRAFDKEMKDRTPENMRASMDAADKEARAKRLAAGVRTRRNATNEEYMDEAIYSEKGKAKAAEMIAARSTPSGRAKSGKGADVSQIRQIRGSGRGSFDREGLGGTPMTPTMAKNPIKKQNYIGTGNRAARRAGTYQEQFELWINSLVEEGYDLSDYTWNEMYEIYLDEAQVANRDPDKYEADQKKKYAPVRGERTPMPPRGNKRREDFEKWYAANVR